MASTGSAHKTEVLREATTMVLYLSIVLLATFTALPGKSGVGVRGAGLVALIWGTALGLTLAHWFAFRLAARAFSSGEVSRTDVQIGMAQVAAAFAVALLCTIPVLMFGDDDEIQMATWVPALIVGLIVNETADGCIQGHG